MNRWIALALAVAAVSVVGIGASSWLAHDPPGPLPAESAGIAGVRHSQARANREVDIPKPPSTPLPSTELPLPTIIEELRRRTSQGDAAAGCRLAAEYLHCAHLPYRKLEFERWLAERRRAMESLHSAELMEEMAKSFDRELALRKGSLDGLQNHCEGVDIPTAAALARLWRASALAGNPAAMKQYASGNAFRFTSLLEALTELQAYRREAERIALIAAQRGDLDMVLALAAAYSPLQSGSRPFLAQIVQPDLARSLALYRYVEYTLIRSGEQEKGIRQVSQRIEELETRSSAAERARSEEIANHELRRWKVPELRGLHRLDTSGRVRDVDRSWCAR